MSSTEPILMEPEMLPLAAPDWAEEFGEDQFGVYCRFRIGNAPFVLRWIPPGRFQMGSPQDENGRDSDEGPQHELRWIPPGRFQMGSPQDENGRDSDEGPQHEVTISQGFWLGETPVTQEQWRAVVKAAATELPDSPSDFKDKPQHPVESVNWHQCVQFCDLVQGLLQSTQPFRLPTEAQWEYACRAGTTSAYHDGSACTEPTGKDPALDRLGWFDENSGRSTCPVRQKVANNWGLYDMHGNVWEWCRDSMRNYKAEACVDPLGSESSGASRALRGGDWFSFARYCRAAYRDTSVPGDVWDSCGLRLSAGPSGFSGGAGDL